MKQLSESLFPGAEKVADYVVYPGWLNIIREHLHATQAQHTSAVVVGAEGVIARYLFVRCALPLPLEAS